LDSGQGRFRVAGRAKEYSGPSKEEEFAAMYNIVCCYSKQGEFESAFVCLEELLESGFDNFESLKTDSDLSSLRSDRRFGPMLEKFSSMPQRVMRLFQSDNKPKKPWLI